MITLILLILVFVFFGLRWFQDGSVKGSSKSGVWPPIVNMCPDFMISWTDNASKNIYCYDASNVYGLKTSTASFMTKDLTIQGTAKQSALLIKDSSALPGVTNLQNDMSLPYKWPLLNSLKTDPSKILNDTNGRLIRWEGVLDGNKITPENAPLP